MERPCRGTTWKGVTWLKSSFDIERTASIEMRLACRLTSTRLFPAGHLSYDARRISHGDRVWWNILRDDRSGPDDASLADGRTGQDDRIDSDVRASPDAHLLELGFPQ